MEKFEFKSQICTTREQSQKLLQLGLKESTADCHWFYHLPTETWRIEAQPYFGLGTYRPAWSLHRLMLLYDKTIEFEDWNLNEAYEHIMILIEDAIRGGFFNSQFLEDKQ